MSAILWLIAIVVILVMMDVEIWGIVLLMSIIIGGCVFVCIVAPDDYRNNNTTSRTHLFGSSYHNDNGGLRWMGNRKHRNKRKYY